MSTKLATACGYHIRESHLKGFMVLDMQVLVVLWTLLLCLDFEVVVGDEEVDGLGVAPLASGKGAGAAREPAHPRPQSAKPALHVVGLAFLLAAAAAAAAVGSGRKRAGVSLPKVAVLRRSR